MKTLEFLEKTTLDKLVGANWVNLSSFGNLEIYGRESLRILYDPSTDSIMGWYRIERDSLLDLHKPTYLDLLNFFKK